MQKEEEFNEADEPSLDPTSPKVGEINAASIDVNSEAGDAMNKTGEISQ